MCIAEDSLPPAILRAHVFAFDKRNAPGRFPSNSDTLDREEGSSMLERVKKQAGGIGLAFKPWPWRIARAASADATRDSARCCLTERFVYECSSVVHAYLFRGAIGGAPVVPGARSPVTNLINRRYRATRERILMRRDTRRN